MEDVFSLLSSLTDSELQEVLVFLKECIAYRIVENRLDRGTELFRQRGEETEVEIESMRISRLRIMKIIDIDEELRRKTYLYYGTEKK